MGNKMAKISAALGLALMVGLSGRPLMANKIPPTSCKGDSAPILMGQIQRLQKEIHWLEAEISKIEDQAILDGRKSYCRPDLVDRQYLVQAGLSPTEALYWCKDEIRKKEKMRADLARDRAEIARDQAEIKALQKKIQDSNAGTCVF